MKSARSLIGVLLLAWACLSGGPMLASNPDGATPQAGAEEVRRAIDAARSALAAGRAAEALDTLADVLQKSPGHAEAAQFQIETLLGLGRYDDALQAYDRYARARQQPDAAALGLVARADLGRTVRQRQDQPILVARALERQARDGDADALGALRTLARSRTSVSPEDLAPTLSLVRLQDGEAEARLGAMLDGAPPDARAPLVQAIGEARARSQAGRVAAMLRDGDPTVRSAAAVALGLLEAREAVPSLRQAFQTDLNVVKMFAAVSLRQLGDGSADAFLDELLGSPIAELRVIAARAYASATARSPQWERAVKALLAAGSNEQHRLLAAELLACCDLPAARAILDRALESPNPLLRLEAARLYESRARLGDAAVARRLLGDPMEGIRVHGAGLALGLARGR